VVKAMPPEVKKRFYLRRAWNNVYSYNRNGTFIILGDVGMGKTYASMAMAEMLDPKFSVDRIVFSVEDFLCLLDKGDKYGKLKRGSCIVFDEIAGSEDAADSRSSLSKTNKRMSFVSTVYRKRGLIVFYCAPYLHQLDKNLRGIGITGIMHMTKIDKKRKMSCASFYWAYPHRDKGEVMKPRPIIKGEDGKLRKCMRIWLPKPSEPLLKIYENKKDCFIETKIKKWHEDLNADKTKGKDANKIDEQEKLKIIAGTMRELGATWKEIAKKVKRSTRTVQTWELDVE